jgi:acetyltransferase-like isoleucine patch superfamily enzyme
MKKSLLFRGISWAARNIYNYPPIGIKNIGSGSLILRPRRIDGASSVSIGHSTYINKNSWINAIREYAGEEYSPQIIIGNHVHIGNYACITCISNVTIHDGCVLSEHVYIADSSHGFNPNDGLIMKQRLVSKGKVLIGTSTFIGYRSCIMPGVTLGRNCIVGANSVVTKSFPDYSMIAGIPAKLIKKYSFEENAWIISKDD